MVKVKKTKELVVGVSPIPPLVIKDFRNYSGFEIELWEMVAKKLDIKFSYKEYDIKELLREIQEGELDLGIGAITRTSERKTLFDFSYLTLESSLAILVNKKKKPILKTLKSFFEEHSKSIFLSALGLLSYFIINTHLMWLIERNGGAITSPIYSEGIFDSFWLTVATATTLGYGDIIPQTHLGKILAMLIVSGGLLIFGLFSGQFASLLTATRIESWIKKPSDLYHKKVATKKGTIAENELHLLGAKVIKTKQIEDSFKLLAQNQVDAVVFDAPVILHYTKEHQNGDTPSVQTGFTTHTYGFALPKKSKIKEEINKTLLEIHDSGEYDLLYTKWFGGRIF